MLDTSWLITQNTDPQIHTAWDTSKPHRTCDGDLCLLPFPEYIRHARLPLHELYTRYFYDVRYLIMVFISMYTIYIIRDHRAEVGLLSGAKRPCVSPPAAGRGQAGFLSGAKRPCTCPWATGRFPFGREAPLYLPTGRRRSAGASREASVASEAASNW